MNKKIKTFIKTATFIAILSIAGLRSVSVSAWGDNSGGDMRPSYSLREINEKADTLGGTPFFNSIQIKDSDYAWYKKHFNKELPKDILRYEKNFVGAREDTGENKGPGNVWNGSNIDVEDGKIYLLRIYVDNNSNSVAKNTTVRFQDVNKVASTLEMVDLEDKKGNATGEKKQMQQVQVNGFISSSNANPSEYWDHINLNADVPFHLEYINDSAQIENNGKAGGSKLGNEIINTGVQIGYNGLDGRISGGYEYACYITIRVKVVYDYDFVIEKKVRLAGDDEWHDTIDAKIGDKVEFQIKYTNTSSTQQDGVAVKDTLPPNLHYISGSTKLKNTHYPSGTNVQEDYLVTDGLKIGSYSPDADAYLLFSAEVVDDSLAEGLNTLVNWVQAGVGDTTLTEEIRVRVQKHTKFYKILTFYGVAIAVYLIAIAIFIYRITKHNRAKKVKQNRK